MDGGDVEGGVGGGEEVVAELPWFPLFPLFPLLPGYHGYRTRTGVRAKSRTKTGERIAIAAVLDSAFRFANKKDWYVLQLLLCITFLFCYFFLLLIPH